ncbi:MAG TPA: Fe-S cluster assembly protein SufD, partial [Gemmatimonadales bacterium]|nr:Fe-S cluster assembly protein SufD [Gemmatimonadales bacterium]
PQWLRELRTEGLERFAAAGFPSTRQEEWRFTSVQPIAEAPFVLTGGDPAAVDRHAAHRFELCEAGRHLLVFANGRYAPELSSVAGLPEGVRVGSLAAALRESGDLVRQYLGAAARSAGSPFGALNTAFIADGAFVYVAPGVRMDEPVQFLYLTAPGADLLATNPRSLIVVDRMARVSIVETYGGVGTGMYWTNAVTEVLVADGARADVYRVQREAETAFHTAVTCTVQGRDSSVHLHPVAFGASLSRHDIHIVMDGENGHSILNGLYLLGGRQHCDHHTTIDHARPHNESHEYMNGVLDGEAHSVFTGRIIVRPGAQRTDSKQTNNNLVLSEQARADSQPQLEIYADDVKCTHGATLGPLDEKALFYLRSRGIDPVHARSLLTYGFGAEIIDRMEIAPLQAQLDRLVRQRLLGGHVR